MKIRRECTIGFIMKDYSLGRNSGLHQKIQSNVVITESVMGLNEDVS